MKPTIGRIVTYNTTEVERALLKNNSCNESAQLPAMIVAVWGESEKSAVNLKVFADGPEGNDFWKTSISVGSEKNSDDELEQGSWFWPQRS